MPAARSRLLGRGQIGYDQRDGTKHKREDLVEDGHRGGLLVHRDNIDPPHPQNRLYPIGPDGVRYRRRPAPPIEREDKVVPIGYLWDVKTGKHLHLPVIGLSVANQGLWVAAKRIEPVPASAVTLSQTIQAALGLGLVITPSNNTITISDNLSSRQWAWTIGEDASGVSVSPTVTTDKIVGGQGTGNAINISSTFTADKIVLFTEDGGPVVLLGTPSGTWSVAYPFGADTYGSHKFGGVADEGDF